MSFEKFTKTNRVFIPKALISLNKCITLNGGAIKKYNIEDASFAVLYYDKKNKKIGIEIVKEAVEGALKIKKRKTSAIFSAKSFINYYEIDIKKSTKYDLSYDGKLLIINLT